MTFANVPNMPATIKNPNLLSEHIANWDAQEQAREALRSADRAGLLQYHPHENLGDYFKGVRVAYPTVFNRRSAHHAVEDCRDALANGIDGIVDVVGETVGTGANGWYSRTIRVNGNNVATFGY